MQTKMNAPFLPWVLFTTSGALYSITNSTLFLSLISINSTDFIGTTLSATRTKKKKGNTKGSPYRGIF